MMSPARPMARTVHQDAERLLGLIRRFSRQRIAVIGDFVADEFVLGEISRVSREAPVLIMRRRNSEFRPGGGANAVNNLAALGARVYAVGLLGNDPAGRALTREFRRKGVDCSGIERPSGYSTPAKTRFLAGWAHTVAQQVLRVDTQPEHLPSPSVLRRLERHARRQSRRADAVLISDYGLGAVSPRLARSVKATVKTLDSRYDMLAYQNAGITAATPNEAEMEALYHSLAPAGGSVLNVLGDRVLRKMRMRAVLVTRGKHGSVLFERARQPIAIPPFGEGDAVDVTGAGDTVIAVFTLALAAGGSFYDAALVANYAGGIVVMKRGTATVSGGELEAAVEASAS